MADDAILGTCQSMCPIAERKLREKEGLLNILEMQEQTKHQKRPQADLAKIVKCYKRSSAGTAMNNPSDLRPGPILLLTVRYLLTKVIMRKDVNWTVIYEFIFDRLRAVRQDMIIQRLNATTSIRLLEPMVCFHIYASERMRDKGPAEYVAKFNDQHLLECIKQLLTLYDRREIDMLDNDEFQDAVDDNRAKIEALYVLLHLGDTTSMLRGLSLPMQYRNSALISNALMISRAWYKKNYVQVCREISKLPPLLFMAALNNLRKIRRDTLEIMSVAYSSMNLTYPVTKLAEILLYNNNGNLSDDCKLFGLEITGSNILFQRQNFKINEPAACVEKIFNNFHLDKLLPNIFFNS